MKEMNGIKILVVDDSKTTRHTANTLLSAAGYSVYLAEDGYAALAAVVKHRPDLVFMDVMMPRLDGYKSCALVKHNKDFANLPIIMLSSKDGLFDKARGRLVGSDHYLTKPFTKDQLLNTVVEHVESSGLEETSSLVS